MSLLLRHIARQCQLHSRRFLSSNSKRFVTYPLLKRGLIKITGIDSSPFLQGLVTNDMNFLESECFALYSMILNPQGRALYDTIIYNYGRLANEKEPTFFVEFDLKAINDVQKVLTLYKIRRKVTITNISEEVKIFHLSTGNQSAIEPADLQFSDKKNVLMCHSDPRLMSFGCRLLVKTGHPGSHVLPNCVDGPDDADYTRLRYQLGIPEGIVEIPPGNRLPLEYNLVYLNGVSFDKGCYVGQELTARTHYTGVIRKRVMPIMLEKTSPHLQAGAEIFSSNQKKAGKYINSLDKYGLALLRLTEANSDLSIHLKNGEKLKVTAHTPTWWPKEDVSKATKT